MIPAKHFLRVAFSILLLSSSIFSKGQCIITVDSYLHSISGTVIDTTTAYDDFYVGNGDTLILRHFNDTIVVDNGGVVIVEQNGGSLIHAANYSTIIFSNSFPSVTIFHDILANIQPGVGNQILCSPMILLGTGQGSNQGLFDSYFNATCSGPTVTTNINGVTATSIFTDFGDGNTANTALQTQGNITYAQLSHIYAVPGTYNVTQVLYDGVTAVDTLSTEYDHILCTTMSLALYTDTDNDCVFTSGIDLPLAVPALVEIDSAGVPMDTVSCFSGLTYTAFGTTGQVYQFKVLSLPGDLITTCPVNGIVNDTLNGGVNPTKRIGVNCGNTSNFDLKMYVSSDADPDDMRIFITPVNEYCSLQNAVLTMNYNTAYTSLSASIPPSSQTAGVATWNLNGLSSEFYSPTIRVDLHGSTWPTGVPVSTSYSITPTTGDQDPTNNSIIVVDTVVGSFDPNAIYVKPEGCVAAGTELEYTITFENMGNGPAENIYVLDTLPAGLDHSTLALKNASHEMYVEKILNGGLVVLKFNFPDIMLPDSTSPDRHGGLTYRIKSKSTLPFGSGIPHRAGIYFDYNDPVMTNTAITGICWPANISNTASQKQGNVLIYPNPATDELTIKTDKRYTSYTISNSIGQVMMKDNLTAKESKVNIRSLAPGIYYIILKGEGSSEVRKFVKM